MRKLTLLFFVAVMYVLQPRVSFSQTGYQSNLYMTSSLPDFVYMRKFIDKDTLINGESFNKIRWETLGFGRDISAVTYEYELLDKNGYKLLDSNLNTIHSFRFVKGKQTGTLFYMEKEIFDTTESFPGISHGPKETLVGYKGESRFSSSIFFNEAHSSVETVNDISTRSSMFHLRGEPSELFCELFDNGVVYPENSPSFKRISDRMQYVLYANMDVIKEFNEERGINMPVDSNGFAMVDIIDIEYAGDTTIDGVENNVLRVSFARLDEGKLDEEVAYSNITDERIINTYNHLENMDLYSDSYPLIGGDTNMESFLGYYIDSSLGPGIGVIVNSIFMPYWGNGMVRYYNDFPFPIVTVTSQIPKLTYLKIDGVEYGERMKIPDTVTTNSILKIDNTRNSISVEFRINDDYEIQVEILDMDGNTLAETKRVEYNRGTHTIKIKPEKKLQKGSTSIINLSYMNVIGQFVYEEIKENYIIK
ncbi:MAG: hypothetical protein KDC42_02770 [Ignavibacteriae bacterium]|nr:hypothetical protein [Ignavibacteriota bacterium]